MQLQMNAEEQKSQAEQKLNSGLRGVAAVLLENVVVKNPLQAALPFQNTILSLDPDNPLARQILDALLRRSSHSGAFL